MKATIPFENTMNLQLGQGFDSVLDVPRGSAVKEFTLSSNAENELPARTTLRLLHLTEAMELEHISSVSASGGMGVGPLRASGSLSLTNSVSRSSFHEYLLAELTVELERILVQPHVFAYPELKREERNLDIFQDQFGDKFVSGVIKGGTLRVLFDYISRSEEEQRAVKATFSAVSTSGSLGASASDFFKEKEKNNRLSVQIVRDGVQEALPKLDVESIIEYVRVYPESLRQSGQYWKQQYLLSDYPLTILSDETSGLLREVLDIYLTLTRRLGDLEYVRDNPDDFGGVNLLRLLSDINVIKDRTLRLRTAVYQASKQANAIKTKSIDSLVRQGSEWLKGLPPRPQRIEWVNERSTAPVKPDQHVYQYVTRTRKNDHKYLILRGSFHMFAAQDQNGHMGDGGAVLIGHTKTDIMFNFANPLPNPLPTPLFIPPDTTVHIRFNDEWPGDNRELGGFGVGVYTPVHPTDFPPPQ